MMIALCASALFAGAPAAAAAQAATYRRDVPDSLIGALLFGDVDAVVLPTVTTVTPTVDAARAAGDQAVAADNTFFCNYFGLPAISVPVALDQRRLPLGMQIVGPHGADESVLGMARAYQDAVRTRYRPPVSA